MPKRVPKAERYKRLCAIAEREEREWAKPHRRVRENVDFAWGGKRYDSDFEESDEERTYSSDEIKWVGQETPNAIRHEVGYMAQEPTSIVARAVDAEGGDDLLAETAVSIIEHEYADPMKMHADVEDEVLISSGAGGYGVATLDVVESDLPWPEVYPRHVRSTDFMFDRAAKNPHEQRCRYTVERMRLTRAELEAWDGLDEALVAAMTPDSGPDDDGRVLKTNAAAVAGRSNVPGEFGEDDEERFTVYKLHYRATMFGIERKDESTFEEYEPDERYMQCDACGHRSVNEGEVGGELPEVAQCPMCEGPLHRIDGMERAPQMVAYPNIQLCVLAPYSGIDKPLWEGPPEVPARSFPYLFTKRTTDPFKPYGPCIADWNAWNQVATDMLMRLALENSVDSAPFRLLPKDGLEDWQGEPWQGGVEQGSSAFYTGGAPVAQVVQGLGLPDSWSSVYEAAQRALTAPMGTADFGLAPGQSRNIPAASVSQQVHQTEIPLEHYKTRWRRDKAIFIGLLWDYLRATATPERLRRLVGEDGMESVAALMETDLPNYDFTLLDAPKYSAADQQEVESLNTFIGILEQRPWAADLYAQKMRISPSNVRKLKQDLEQARMQAQQAQAAAAGVAAQAPNPEGAPPEGAPQGQGLPPQEMVQSLLTDMGMAQQQPQGVQ